MDPQQPVPPPVESTPLPLTTEEKKGIPKKLLIIIGIFVVLIIIGAVVTIAVSSKNEKKEAQQQTTTETLPPLTSAPYVLVYGAWKGENSVIYATDLTTKKEYELAILPENIKKVVPISQTELLYIADTNGQDHGQSLKVRDLTTGTDTTIYSALNDYGIDDYRVSPNGQYIATWEVKFEPNNNILTGGNSKVVTIDRQNPTATNTLYEEVANQPVHYAIGITNEGKVFLDTFLPNTGAGWAHGMSISDLTGAIKTEIPQLANGTYGTQPVMSKDGTYVATAGYDGTNGPGDEEINGFRRAVVTPNTVVILDTDTNAITTVPELPNQDSYTAVNWNEDNTLMVSVASSQKGKNGSFVLNPDSGILTSNRIGDLKDTYAINSLNNVWLNGKYDGSSSSLGNLGETYSQPYSKFILTNPSTKTQTIVTTSVPLMQYIAFVPQASISKTVLQNEISESQQTEASIQGNEIRLGTFTKKPGLEPTREKQQSDLPPAPTPTPTVKASTPGRLGGGDRGSGLTDPDPTSPPKNELPFCDQLAKERCGVKSYEDALAKTECLIEQESQLRGSGICQDSPLYLYGPEGTIVSIKISTQITNENIKSDNNNYTFQLLNNGLFKYKNSTYTSLAYDYKPAIFAKPPKYGAVVHKDNLVEKVTEYANNLDLNIRETKDLISEVQTNATSEYVFLSFYDQSTSKLLLPISFQPKPDTYINYVFYLKNLNTKDVLMYSPKNPTFPTPQQRGKFTAVEISLITE